MSYDETQRRISLDADASLAIRTGVPGMPGSADPNGGKQYYFVKVTGEHKAGAVSTAGGDSVGVMQNKPQILGEAATVAISGISLVVAGGTLEAGDSVSSDNTGKSVKTAGEAKVLATCILGAGNGQLATVLLRMN